METQIQRLQAQRDLSDTRTTRLVQEIERLKAALAATTRAHEKSKRRLRRAVNDVRRRDQTVEALRTALQLANLCVQEKDKLLLQLTSK